MHAVTWLGTYVLLGVNIDFHVTIISLLYNLHAFEHFLNRFMYKKKIVQLYVVDAGYRTFSFNH